MRTPRFALRSTEPTENTSTVYSTCGDAPCVMRSYVRVNSQFPSTATATRSEMREAVYLLTCLFWNRMRNRARRVRKRQTRNHYIFFWTGRGRAFKRE